MLEFELKYERGSADEGLIEFYDAAQALAGFQRSLALTIHLVLNGEIITQAPHVQGFQILIPPFERGSWRSKALVAFSLATSVLSAGKDSPLGQFVTSVYDYALKSIMGYHVDYSKTIQQQYHDYVSQQKVTESRLDSLCEKIEASVADIHRPIAISRSATSGRILQCSGHQTQVGGDFNIATYEHVKQTIKNPNLTDIEGYVSSYNVNTFKGKIYSISERRPISFELIPEIRNSSQVGIVTRSQHFNGQHRGDPRALIRLTAHELHSKANKIKSYLVVNAERLG